MRASDAMIGELVFTRRRMGESLVLYDDSVRDLKESQSRRNVGAIEWSSRVGLIGGAWLPSTWLTKVST